MNAGASVKVRERLQQNLGGWMYLGPAIGA